MKSRLIDWVARYAVVLYLLVPLCMLALVFWKLPGLALAAGATLATAAIFAFMQGLLSSPERAREWHDAVIIIGNITSIIVPLGVFIAGVGAISLWYPFRPIVDVPFAQLTLGAIVTDLFGVILLGVLAVFAEGFYKAFRADLYNSGKFGISLALVVVGVLIIYRQMS